MSDADSTGEIHFVPLPKRSCFKDRTGTKWGRWNILGYAGSDTSGDHSRWWCQCDCGTVRKIGLSKNTQSCGCLQREAVRKANETHADWGSKEYFVWHGMMQRCYNEGHNAYHNYGGRGISVCPEWHTYVGFFADMGRRPSTKHSIDRIDNEGNYCPQNCRWATKAEQVSNTRRSRFVEMDGERKTLMQWVRQFGLKYGTLRGRLDRGQSLKEALAGIEKRRKLRMT